MLWAHSSLLSLIRLFLQSNWKWNKGKKLLLTPNLVLNSFMLLTNFCLDTTDNSLTPSPWEKSTGALPKYEFMFFKQKWDLFETAYPCKQRVPTTEPYFDCVSQHLKSNKGQKKPYKTRKLRKIPTAVTGLNLQTLNLSLRPVPLKRGNAASASWVRLWGITGLLWISTRKGPGLSTLLHLRALGSALPTSPAISL